MNNRNTLLRCASFWNNIQNSIPVHSRFTWNKREPPRTIQNWHFVRRMARRESGVIPRIRAAQGTSDGCNFGERERVTEQVRRDYTKCKFCIIEGSEMRGKRHIAQNACISLCGARRLQDKYITIFAFTLATRRSVSRQTYQTARSFRRTRLRRTVEDACPYSLRVALIVGRILRVVLQVSF